MANWMCDGHGGYIEEEEKWMTQQRCEECLADAGKEKWHRLARMVAKGLGGRTRIGRMKVMGEVVKMLGGAAQVAANEEAMKLGKEGRMEVHIKGGENKDDDGDNGETNDE